MGSATEGLAARHVSLKVECADGLELEATEFLPVPQLHTRGVILIAPALGVPRKVYAKFSNYLAASGFAVLCADYRGCGKNSSSGDQHNANQSRKPPRLHEWGSLDLTAMIEYAAKAHPGQKIFLLGHSIGAQLVGLSNAAHKLSGLVFVAGSFPYWRRWPWPARLSMGFMFAVVIPLICACKKNFPTQALGLGSVTMQSSLMADWARWIRKDDYLLDRKFGFDASGYQRMAVPVLAFGFDDDKLVPKASLDKLLGVYSACKIDLRYINAAANPSGAIGHMGFFREAHRETLWADTLRWLDTGADKNAELIN